jgi:hypothetical protein
MRIHQKLLEAAAASRRFGEDGHSYASGSQSARSAAEHHKEFHARLLAAGIRAQQEKESKLKTIHPSRRETAQGAAIDEHSHVYAQLLRRRSRPLSPSMVEEESSDEDGRTDSISESSSAGDDGLSEHSDFVDEPTEQPDELPPRAGPGAGRDGRRSSVQMLSELNTNGITPRLRKQPSVLLNSSRKSAEILAPYDRDCVLLPKSLGLVDKKARHFHAAAAMNSLLTNEYGEHQDASKVARVSRCMLRARTLCLHGVCRVPPHWRVDCAQIFNADVYI